MLLKCLFDIFLSYGGGGAGYQPGFGRANFGGTGGSSFYDSSDGRFPAFDVGSAKNPNLISSLTRSVRAAEFGQNKDQSTNALEKLSSIQRLQQKLASQNENRKKRPRDALSTLDQMRHSLQMPNPKSLDWPALNGDGFVLIVPQVENCCDGRYPCLVLNGESGGQSVDTICVCGWMHFERKTCHKEGLCKFGLK